MKSLTISTMLTMFNLRKARKLRLDKHPHLTSAAHMETSKSLKLCESEKASRRFNNRYFYLRTIVSCLPRYALENINLSFLGKIEVCTGHWLPLYSLLVK